MRDAIVAAARDLFYEKGIDGTSMRDIASRLGLAQSSLYNHFKTKEAIVLAALDTSFAIIGGPVLRVFEGGEPSLAQLREALYVHALQHAVQQREGAIFDIREHLMPEALREGSVADRDLYERRFQDLVARLAACGCVGGAELNIKVKFLLTAGVSIGKWYRPGDRLDATEIAEVFADSGMTVLQAHRPCAGHAAGSD
jgi:AcrR family transcriptional regulator